MNCDYYLCIILFFFNEEPNSETEVHGVADDSSAVTSTNCKDGNSWTDVCNTCICVNDTEVCTKKFCFGDANPKTDTCTENSQ